MLEWARRMPQIIDGGDMDPLGQQKAETFHEVLTQLSSSLLYIHKMQIQSFIDKENHGLLATLPLKGTARFGIERIGNHTVEYNIHPNGSVMIYVTCSYRPFRLYEEHDVLDILLFLGRVEDRLKDVLSDTKDRVVPPVKQWILKGCDVNKDIEIGRKAQLTLPDMQIPFFEKTLRAYVKPIGDRVYYRVELSLEPDGQIEQALDCLRSETKIDANCFSLG
jgi:hypothetical protein